jgi:hypothetical protein
MRRRFRYDPEQDCVVEVTLAEELIEGPHQHHASKVDNFYFKAWSVEPNAPGAKHYDKDGQPFFTSRKEIEEFCAVNDRGYEYEF